jgi:hypothetical protein
MASTRIDLGTVQAIHRELVTGQYSWAIFKYDSTLKSLQVQATGNVLESMIEEMDPDSITFAIVRMKYSTLIHLIPEPADPIQRLYSLSHSRQITKALNITSKIVMSSMDGVTIGSVIAAIENETCFINLVQKPAKDPMTVIPIKSEISESTKSPITSEPIKTPIPKTKARYSVFDFSRFSKIQVKEQVESSQTATSDFETALTNFF